MQRGVALIPTFLQASSSIVSLIRLLLPSFTPADSKRVLSSRIVIMNKTRDVNHPTSLSAEAGGESAFIFSIANITTRFSSHTLYTSVD